MTTPLQARTHWSTSSFADASGAPSLETDGLGQHLRQCSQARSQLLALRSGLDALHRGLLGRFVTSLTLMVALVGTTVLVW